LTERLSSRPQARFATPTSRHALGTPEDAVQHGQVPDDRCQCAHWGYIISGTMRVYGVDGARDYEAGETYY
jgi:hypothetical protein